MPILHILMCVPRYDSDIKITVRLTGIVKSTSVLEVLKWEKESVHFRISECCSYLIRLLGGLSEFVFVKGLTTGMGTKYALNVIIIIAIIFSENYCMDV